MVNPLMPITPQALGSYLAQWLPKVAAAGITGVFDGGVPPIGDQTDLLALHTALEAQGRLTLRVVASYVHRAAGAAPPVPLAR